VYQITTKSLALI